MSFTEILISFLLMSILLLGLDATQWAGVRIAKQVYAKAHQMQDQKASEEQERV